MSSKTKLRINPSNSRFFLLVCFSDVELVNLCFCTENIFSLSSGTLPQVYDFITHLFIWLNVIHFIVKTYYAADIVTLVNMCMLGNKMLNTFL